MRPSFPYQSYTNIYWSGAVGLEPTVFGTTVRRFSHLNYCPDLILSLELGMGIEPTLIWICSPAHSLLWHPNRFNIVIKHKFWSNYISIIFRFTCKPFLLSIVSNDTKQFSHISQVHNWNITIMIY